MRLKTSHFLIIILALLILGIFIWKNCQHKSIPVVCSPRTFDPSRAEQDSILYKACIDTAKIPSPT